MLRLLSFVVGPLLVVWFGFALFLTPAESKDLFADLLLPLWGFGLLFFGAIQGLAEWREGVRKRVLESKPLVLTDHRDASSYEIRNVGGGVGVNVWYLEEAEPDRLVCLGHCPLASRSRSQIRPNGTYWSPNPGRKAAAAGRRLRRFWRARPSATAS